MDLVEKPQRKVTGWHVAAIFVAFFAVIIAVNVGLAWKAISTFPGLEVDNSYVASQTFNAEMAAQKALGWTLKSAYDPDLARVILGFTDGTNQPVTLSGLEVLIGRTTETTQDVRPAFVLKDGIYTAPARLAAGKWMMAVTAHATDGTLFHQRIDLFVNR